MTVPIDRTTRPAERLAGHSARPDTPGVVPRSASRRARSRRAGPHTSTDGNTVADNVEPEHMACARGRVQKSEQQTDRRALPGAVRSQEAENLAFVNRDVERLERPNRWRRPDERQAERERAMPVVFRQPAGRDYLHRGECSARPSIDSASALRSFASSGLPGQLQISRSPPGALHRGRRRGGAFVHGPRHAPAGSHRTCRRRRGPGWRDRARGAPSAAPRP